LIKKGDLDMYEYKFVEIKSKLGISSGFKEYEDIVKKHALEGWRFVTVIPVQTRGLEGVTVLSLVFEKTI